MCNKKLKIIDITHARLNELGDGKKVVTECLAIIMGHGEGKKSTTANLQKTLTLISEVNLLRLLILIFST